MKIFTLKSLSISLLKRKKKYLIFLFLSFFLINTTQSQENDFKEVEAFKEFKNTEILTITQDQFNNIWLGTNQGLLRFDGNEIKNFELKIDNSTKNISTILCKNDAILIGKNKTLHVKTKNQLFTYDVKNVNKIVTHKNNVFIGTNQGILHVREDYLQPLKTTYSLDFSIVNDIIFFDNYFIIGTNNGLWKIENLFEPKGIKQISKGNFTSFLNIDNQLFALKNNNVILELKKDTLIEKYTKENIFRIKIIKNKIYVISKNEGIDILNPDTFIFEKRITKYNSNINSNQINDVFEDAENNIFIATKNKLFLNKNLELGEKTNLFLSEISVNFNSVDSINLQNYRRTLHLKPNQNNVSFLFESISINQPKNILYRYKLNNQFSPWSNKNQVDFANLKSGDYVFKVESKFKNKNKVSTIAFNFFIDNPIYKKVWFLLGCFVFVCLILAGFIELYIRNIKKKNKQKITELKRENHLLSLEQKALQLQMNPHFIFNVLNGIKALGNNENKAELNKSISQFSVLLRSVLNNSRLEEISLQEEIETLQNYLSLEQKMNSKSFKFSIETSLNNIDSEEILIPPMLVQPFVENAIKHGISSSYNGEIIIKFNVKYRFLECTITDNGNGFYQTQKQKTKNSHKSIAVKITKERIKNLSKYSQFSIEELKNENSILGTKIWFKIPLKTDY